MSPANGDFTFETVGSGNEDANSGGQTNLFTIQQNGEVGIGTACHHPYSMFCNQSSLPVHQLAFTVAGGAHTTLTASTEAIDANFNLARTVQFAAGALATQRAALQAPA